MGNRHYFYCSRCGKQSWSNDPMVSKCKDCRTNPKAFYRVGKYHLELDHKKNYEFGEFYYLTLFDRTDGWQEKVNDLHFVWQINKRKDDRISLWYNGTANLSRFKSVEEARMYAEKQRKVIRDEIISGRFRGWPTLCTNCQSEVVTRSERQDGWKECPHCGHLWVRFGNYIQQLPDEIKSNLYNEQGMMIDKNGDIE